MAKSAREKIKLESSAGTGHFYTTSKNKRTMTQKMEIKKFDPKARKHVMYKEGKISYDDALRHADSANEVRLMIKLDEGGDAESLAKGLEGVEVLGDKF